MDKIMQEKLRGLIDEYIKARDARQLEDENDYCEKIAGYRKWLNENILDINKLKNYSDEEFARKFGEMFDYMDGGNSVRGLTRGMHFNSDDRRLAVRSSFENMISYICNESNDHFVMLDEVLNPNSPYKVPGLGSHVATALINAKYPDVPPINATTKEFFKNIGDPLPNERERQQQVVRDFFADMKNLSDSKLTNDDINHIFWYSKTIDSGRDYMMRNFPETFDNTVRVRRSRGPRKRIMTREERIAERIAELQAIQNQAK